jgi:HK97 gp10 family phage protein
MVTGDASEFIALAARFENASGRIGAPVSAAVRKTATAIETDARALAPEGPTGDLRDSIHTVFLGDGRGAVMDAEVIADVPYARFVEEGTSKMAPQPFMTPAGDRHHPALGEAIDKAAGDLL